MESLAVVLTMDPGNIPENFIEILEHEQKIIAEWKKEGILEYLFLPKDRGLAVLVFRNIDFLEVKEKVGSLPLFQFFKSVEYLNQA